MFRINAVLLSVLALFAVNGIAASTASASGPYWHVNGLKLEMNTKQIKMQLKGAFVLKAAASMLEIVCKKGVSEGTTIEGNVLTQGQGKGRLAFSQCVVPELPSCTVAEPITTNPLKSYLATAGTQTQDVDVFEPGQGTVLFTIFFNKGCGPFFGGEFGAAGVIAAEIIPSEVETHEALVVFPSKPIGQVKREGIETKLPEVKMIGVQATISAAFGARLQSGEQFGAYLK